MTTMNDRECLDVTTWFDRMRRLVEGLSDEDAALDRHIRKAYHLHRLAPEAIKPLLPIAIEESRMEAMLRCGAYESAISSLVGGAGRMTLCNGDRGAGIQVNQHFTPRRAAAEDTAEAWPLAMLEAWATSFLRLRARTH